MSVARILRGMLGKTPSGPKARVRNFIANARLGTEAITIHENVLTPGVVVPWHMHAIEEVIVVLSGAGECRTEKGSEAYSAGDVLIVPAGLKHSIRNAGATVLRQLCVFPGEPLTPPLGTEGPGQTVEIFNA